MIIKYARIWCDNGDCVNRYEAIVYNAKAEAKALGWSFKLSAMGMVHMCPRCQASARGDANGKGK